MRKVLLRKVAAACIVAAGFSFVAFVFTAGLTNESVAERDFISYWAAGQLLAHGANPYDFEAVRKLEHTAGRPDDSSLLVMRNPPVAFFLAWPLGFFGPKTAFKLWLLVLLTGLSLSPWIIWLLSGRPDSRLHLLGYAFAPAIACLKAGQFGIFLLVGVTLFLFFYRSRPFIAGTALLLCVLKPHLFFPFAAVLLLWSVRRKDYRILAGFSAALLASCALSFCLDRHAWSQYSRMMHTGGALDEVVPVLSVSFRFLIDRNAVWLQFLPDAVACVWALWYFWTRRDRWNWMDQGLVVLLVSAMCTPFGWFTDESMLLPVVITGLYRAAGSRSLFVLIGLINGIALIEVFAPVRLTSPFYLWTTPAWLGWYLLATRNKRTRTEEIRPGLATAESQ